MEEVEMELSETTVSLYSVRVQNFLLNLFIYFVKKCFLIFNKIMLWRTDFPFIYLFRDKTHKIVRRGGIPFRNKMFLK